jgi:hypothetical protein
MTMNLKQYKEFCDLVYPEPPQAESWDNERKEYFSTKIFIHLGEVAKAELEDDGTLAAQDKLKIALAHALCAATCGTDLSYLPSLEINPREWPLQPIPWGETVDRWNSNHGHGMLENVIEMCGGYGFFAHDIMLVSIGILNAELLAIKTSPENIPEPKFNPIKIEKLGPSDVGRLVVRRTRGPEADEKGVITSWSEHYVFVRYNLDSKIGTSQATIPGELLFVEDL